MSYAIKQNESNNSLRQVYLWCVQSNGTSAATNEATGQPRMSVGGLPMWATANTLSAVSANAGLYRLTLGDSDVSVLGQGTIQYSSGTALPSTVNVEIVGYDPFVAFSRFSSSDSVGLKAQVHSGASVGVVDVAPAVGAISGLSFVPAPGTHSAVTIGGVEALESGVTVDTGGIVAASFGAGAIDAVALATDAGQEIADRVLGRSIMGGSDSGRTVSEALAALRNRVAIDGSTMTVYQTNDTTSYWTASVTTVSANSGILTDINPQ